MLLWLLLACGSASEAPVDLDDCEDLECVGAWAVRTWREDPEQVLSHLAVLQPDAARVAVVLEVAEAHPGRSAEVCGALKPGPVAARCRNINERAHLWTIPSNDPAAHHEFSGDVARLFEGPLAEPYPELPPALVPCEGERVRASCQTLAAEVLVRERGDAEGAAARCAAVEEGRWRSECYFNVAEALCVTRDEARCGSAARLCLGAGEFAVPCFVDVAGRVAARAPSADDAGADAWAPLILELNRAREELGSRSEGINRRYAARVWSEALALAYADAELTGAPFAALPAEAIPHARAALTARAMRGAPARGLADWVAHVADLEAMTQGSDTPSKRAREAPQPRGYWSKTLPAEATLSATSYLGDARRATHPDPDVDRAICVLEAAGRASPPALDLLAEGAGHAEPVVRWTAVRLLAAVSPEHPALAVAAADPSSLVAHRASTQNQGR